MKLLSLLLIALPAIAVAQPAPSPPADPTVQGRELFQQGKRYFDVADYPHAIEAWKQAYVVAPTPILLFNIGQAYRLSGDCTQALRFYANYEREQPTPPNQAELDQAKALCVAALQPKPPEPKPPEPKPQPPVVPLTAAQLGSADLDGGSAAAPRPLAPVHAESDAGGGLRIGGIVVGSVGLGLVVTGVVSGALAHRNASTLDHFKGAWTPQQVDTQSSGKTESTVAVITWSLGGAALIGGVVLYALGVHAQTESHVSVSIAPQLTEVSWTARF